MFTYNNGQIPRIDDGFLYHFTTAESLFKIVGNMTLKLSSFTLLNDLNEDEKMFIKENYDHLFFKKYIDWEQEHERRFFGIDLPDFLSIKGCIEFICLGRRFNNENLLNLIHLIVTPEYESYLQLTPHDFTIQLNSNGAVRPQDWAGRFLETVKKSNNDTSKYLKYLKENGYANSDLC